MAWRQWWERARAVGRGIFYISMGLATVVFVGLGVAAAMDAADGQPVIWGTYTEQDCEPATRGCDSIGRWVSDDGTIVRERTRLDGSPGLDGTVRASFQPEGRLNDTDNNIVHTETFSSAGLWFPWVGALLTVGAAVGYGYKWRGERTERKVRAGTWLVVSLPQDWELDEATTEAIWDDFDEAVERAGGDAVEWDGDDAEIRIGIVVPGGDPEAVWAAVRPVLERLPVRWLRAEVRQGFDDPNPRRLP